MAKDRDQHQEAVNQLYDWIAHRLIKDKKAKDDIVSLLVEQGISPETATRMVEEVAEEWKQKTAKKARTDMILGAIILAAGIVGSSIDSFQMYGVAVVVGIVVFFRGVTM
jgi:N-acetylglutamate synthase/N-acetylornithine aminotransferase